MSTDLVIVNYLFVEKSTLHILHLTAIIRTPVSLRNAVRVREVRVDTLESLENMGMMVNGDLMDLQVKREMMEKMEYVM